MALKWTVDTSEETNTNTVHTFGILNFRPNRDNSRAVPKTVCLTSTVVLICPDGNPKFLFGSR
jgi:hypothetical protein